MTCVITVVLQVTSSMASSLQFSSLRVREVRCLSSSFWQPWRVVPRGITSPFLPWGSPKRCPGQVTGADPGVWARVRKCQGLRGGGGDLPHASCPNSTFHSEMDIHRPSGPAEIHLGLLHAQGCNSGTEVHNGLLVPKGQCV